MGHFLYIFVLNNLYFGVTHWPIPGHTSLRWSPATNHRYHLLNISWLPWLKLVLLNLRRESCSILSICSMATILRLAAFTFLCSTVAEHCSESDPSCAAKGHELLQKHKGIMKMEAGANWRASLGNCWNLALENCGRPWWTGHTNYKSWFPAGRSILKSWLAKYLVPSTVPNFRCLLSTGPDFTRRMPGPTWWRLKSLKPG